MIGDGEYKAYFEKEELKRLPIEEINEDKYFRGRTIKELYVDGSTLKITTTDGIELEYQASDGNMSTWTIRTIN